jgi:hypothetical protein
MVAAANMVEVAALVGNTTRATVLAALMGGQALTGSELAFLARVSHPTASEHLTKLVEARSCHQSRTVPARYFGSDNPSSRKQARLHERRHGPAECLSGALGTVHCGRRRGGEVSAARPTPRRAALLMQSRLEGDRGPCSARSAPAAERVSLPPESSLGPHLLVG